VGEISDTTSGVTRRGFALGAAAALAAADPADPLPFRRGIGVHHLMNWPELLPGAERDYVWPPFQSASYYMADQELARLRALGFDWVRLTVAPDIFMRAEGPERARFLRELLTRHVERFLGHGLSVVVDLHPVRNVPAYAGTALLADPGRFAAYQAMTGELAATLARLPHGRVALELFNEPLMFGRDGPARWGKMLEALHAAARRGSERLPLVLTGADWSNPEGLIAVDPRPYRGGEVWWTFHYYRPHLFTHQGVDPAVPYVAGLTWPSGREGLSRALGQAVRLANADRSRTGAEKARALAATRRALRAHFAREQSPARVAADFDRVARWASVHGVPAGRVLLGEFGTVRDGAVLPPDARARWLRTVRQTAEARGFGWSLWAYRGREMGLFGEESGAGAADLEALGLNLRA
jgi:hypothetical protein